MIQHFFKIGFNAFWVFLLGFIFIPKSYAFNGVNIRDVRSSPLEGNIHHGIVITTDGIDDSNLSFYEVQVKPDTGQPLPPYKTYSDQIKPFDSKIINIPYRNGILALAGNKQYCVKIRAIYGNQTTPWAERCGIQLNIPPTPNGDMDRDGLTDFQEYQWGSDPRDTDSDGDGWYDGGEVADGADPNVPAFPNLIIRTPSIDFGSGDFFGRRPNQHKYIEIENVGENTARILSLRIQDRGPNDPADRAFHLGTYPQILSYLPPHNIMRIPVSFIPQQRGLVEARIEIQTTNPAPLASISLKGVGVEIADCDLSPLEIDFGTVNTNDQEVALGHITLGNRQLVANGIPPNLDETPLGFTIESTVEGIAPGLRGFILGKDEVLDIPILFQHPHPGDYEGEIKIKSAYCGTQTIKVKGVAQ